METFPDQSIRNMQDCTSCGSCDINSILYFLLIHFPKYVRFNRLILHFLSFRRAHRDSAAVKPEITSALAIILPTNASGEIADATHVYDLSVSIGLSLSCSEPTLTDAVVSSGLSTS